MKNKIALIIAMALVAVLVATTVVLGVVKKDYSPSVQTNYQSVVITKTDDSNYNYVGGKLDNSESYNKIVKLYDDSFKQSFLASLFAGNLSNDISVSYSSGQVPYSVEGYKVVWTLNNEGEKINLTNSLQTEYTVNKLTVGVQNSNGFKEVTIYSNIKGSSTGYLRITTIANFEALYDYLETLKA